MNSILDEKLYNQIDNLAGKLLNLQIADDSINTKEKMFLAIATAVELKIPIMNFVKSVSYISKYKDDSKGNKIYSNDIDKKNRGKLTLPIAMIVALAYRTGKVEYIKETIFINSEGDLTATCTIKRKGMSAPITYTFSEKEALEAGSIKSNEEIARLKTIDPEKARKELYKPWYRFRKRMLQLKPRGYAVRDAFGDALLGIAHSTEEINDSLISEEDENLLSNCIEQKVQIKNQPFSDNEILIPFQDLQETIISKIQSINSSEDYEKYQIWSNNNKKIFATIEKNKQLEIGKLFQSIKNKLFDWQNNSNSQLIEN